MKKTCNYIWLLKPNVNFQKLLLTMKIVTMLLFCGLALPAYSLAAERPSGTDALQQQIKVTGTLTDAATNQPMIGVNVTVKGTTVGAISDINGKYTLTVTDPNSTLVFSFIGYVTQEMALGGKTTLDISMAAEVSQLNEVVVIGYGTQKKVTASGSISTTKGADIVKSPSTTVSNSLVGRMPGLTAVQRSGEPGQDGALLRIRGSNTLGNNNPLIVVDGVPNRSMDRLNPNDIQSVTILKDASAAIYGSQAANGVILVTTKRGAIGKPQISLNMYYGFQQPTKIPDMANATQYATMLNEIAYYKNPAGGRNQKYSADDLQKYTDGSDPWGHPNTDWFHEVFKPWSAQNQINASISGGTDNMKYFLSLGSRFQDGVYHNSATSYKQYDFRSNIDGKITKNINIGFDVAGREEVRDYPTRSAGSIFRMLMRGKPNMPAFWPNGDPGPDIEYGDNPAVTSTSATGYDVNKVYVLNSNLRANISLPWVNGLSVTLNGSFDKTFNFQKRFETPWYLYTWDGNPEHITVKGKRGLDAPQLTEYTNDGQNISLNGYITYERTFAEKHNVKFMAGAERRNGHNDNFQAFRKNYISSAVDQLFAGATDQYMSNTGSASQNAYQSYFGRVNYDLSRKYMIEFVWRYDGSYMFPESKRYGFFPGVSAGWRISEEDFWKSNIAFINDFKIRGSWGQTGNDRIAEYQYLATYGYLSGRSYVFNGVDAKLLLETKVPNPNVTWEVANQANIGFDAALFNNKITVTADYFNNLRSQILIQRNASVPATAGFTLPPENIGKVKNRGFEGVIGYNGASGAFTYNISVNGSYSKNEVVFWDETPGIPEYQRSTGKPMPSYDENSGTFSSDLYYQAIGIFKDQAAIDAYPHWAGAIPGDVIFEDVNKDGVIDGLDRVRNEKNNMPRFIGGMSFDLKYKGFDLMMLIQGASGAMVYVNPESGEIGNYYKLYADNRWTPENTNTAYPRAWNRDEEYWRSQANTFWLQNMNYVRLKNFELGYTLPASVNQTLHIANLRFYVNGQNLLTKAKQSLIDPELQAGTDYPLQRIVTGGLTLTF
jgi:TonB-dependent starch-binding outer membrane protein SusC